MKVLIIEDEAMASGMLSKMISDHFPELKIVGVTESVSASLNWLNSNPTPDIIFMDVELSDGNCFEIFRHTQLKSQIIMTTAYDMYAVQAFEAGSIDYLLKPVSLKALSRAVNRCKERMEKGSLEAVVKALGHIYSDKAQYKNRWIVRVGDKIIPVDVSDIAYFISEDKSNSVVVFDSSRYIVDMTMDFLEQQLDPEQFFRISRGCIVSRAAVKSVTRHLNGRLKLSVRPEADAELLVSRARVDDFLDWLE